MESISTNSKRKNQENIIRTRKYTFNSLAFITTYIDKCITHLNYLEENGIIINEMYYELIYDFSNYISNNLEVKDIQEYKQVENYVKRADIILESAFQDKDSGPIISSFNKLKHNLIKIKVFPQP